MNVDVRLDIPIWVPQSQTARSAPSDLFEPNTDEQTERDFELTARGCAMTPFRGELLDPSIGVPPTAAQVAAVQQAAKFAIAEGLELPGLIIVRFVRTTEGPRGCASFDERDFRVTLRDDVPIPDLLGLMFHELGHVSDFFVRPVDMDDRVLLEHRAMRVGMHLMNRWRAKT